MSENSMAGKITEHQLIEGVKGLDPARQKELYDLFSAQMFRICLRYAHDRAEAEDMLQDGFVKVFRDIGQFRGDGPLGAWIRRIMVNTALSHLRKKKNLIVNVPDYQVFESNSIEQPVFDSNIDAEKLLGFLQTLPLGYRTVFNLYAIEGYTHEEIADKLSISIGTSKSQLFKARDFIKKMLEREKYIIDGEE
jgi:RNA polymerase sigma factor (sigma-70 family)